MRISTYNAQAGIDYAHKWGFSRNPIYGNFVGMGGDCTNFISQCLFAGSKAMNYRPVLGWYYKNINNRTPSWTGVEYLYNFLTSNKGNGPFGSEISISDIKPGDIVQLSFNNVTFAHSLYVVSVGTIPSLQNVLVSTHTFNADYKPVSTYNFSRYRVIHINGVRTL